jgi:hypothetical protein
LFGSSTPLASTSAHAMPTPSLSNPPASFSLSLSSATPPVAFASLSLSPFLSCRSLFLSNAQTRTHARTHTHFLSYAQTHTHAHTHTHTHTHTHLALARLVLLVALGVVVAGRLGVAAAPQISLRNTLDGGARVRRHLREPGREQCAALLPLRQYSYVCTSKASKVRTWALLTCSARL